MKKLSDLIQQKGIERNISKQSNRNEKLLTAWETVSGDSARNHTVSIRLRNGICTVYMDSSVWQQELLLRDRKETAEQMARETGKTIIDVRIKTGDSSL
jgi:hypothetical protein